ncbi:hypothetical protein ACOSOMT5_P2948 [Acidiphilium sp. MT5]
MPGSFIDTNVLVYLASGDPAKADRAEQIAAAGGTISVSNGASAVNALGLTTPVLVRSVYLTSGPSRKMYLGKQVVKLRHAPQTSD